VWWFGDEHADALMTAQHAGFDESVDGLADGVLAMAMLLGELPCGGTPLDPPI
jgi:hypothetical protein